MGQNEQKKRTKTQNYEKSDKNMTRKMRNKGAAIWPRGSNIGRNSI